VLGCANRVGIEHDLVGEQMPSSPSTKHLIPSWLIITAALFVIVVLVVVSSGGVGQSSRGLFGHVSRTETTTTHTTYDEQGKVLQEEKETASTTQKPTPWDVLGLVFVPVFGGLIITVVSHMYNKRQREREEAVQTLRAQDEALQKYLDQMSDLLVNRGLRPQPEDSEPNGAQKHLGQVSNLFSNLLVNLKTLGSEPEDSEFKGHVRDLANARTQAALLGLDSEHKRRPLKLVYELRLIERGNPVLELKNAGLDGANLSELTLHKAHLKCFDLRLADLKGADLQRSDLNLADLRGSNLKRADLKNVDLTEANLLPYDERDPERWSLHNLTKPNNSRELRKERLCPRRLKVARALNTGLPWHTFRKIRWRGLRPTISKLTITNLKGATLAGACLHKTFLGGADLTNADLTNADLTGAVLTYADLTGAVLTYADLSNAEGVTSKQLNACKSLTGATMPAGQKYEEWLKSTRAAGRMGRTVAVSNRP
jgi:uncharacterized protein YjbI with pentapeptide repeats